MNDILFAAGASGAQFTGISMSTVGSNENLAVATKGGYILPAHGTVTASFPVSCDGADSVANAGSVAGNLAHQRIVGRALTSAASGGFAIIQIGRS